MAKDANDPKLGQATRAVLAGRKPEWTGPVVNPPVWRASTHLYDTVAEKEAALTTNRDGDFFYGRRGAPTQWALADALTALEPGAAGTQLYPSGVAALAGAMLAVLKPGDSVLITDNAYEPSRLMGLGLLKRMGVETRFFDPLDLDAFGAAFDATTKAILLESPGSLTMEVCDVPALCAIAHDKGATVLIDNTWATPLGFPALEHGCDIAIMSLSKHAGGHSDLMMGAATGGKRWYAALRRMAQQLGQVVAPDDAALVSRGLRTMPMRLEHQTRSAILVARFLAEHPRVAAVMCPVIPGDHSHELWQRDFSGGCGLFSFVLKNADETKRARVIDRLDLFGIGYSWGGYESLALPFDPAPIRDIRSWPPAGCGPHDRMGIRLSIGLEDAEDLIADLAQSLDRMDAE